MKEPKQIILHGDSREKFRGCKNIRSVITDPPFGSNNQSNFSVTPEGKEHARKIANDESPEIALKVFDEVMKTILPGCMEESDVYVFTAYQVLAQWILHCDELFKEFGYTRRSILVWIKVGGLGLGDLNSWANSNEFILYFKRGDRVPTEKRRNGAFEFNKIASAKLIHPHEKPTELLAEFIKYSTSPGELVVDPFGGSGSLARAARDTGRSAVTCEYDLENYQRSVKAFEMTEGGLF